MTDSNSSSSPIATGWNTRANDCLGVPQRFRKKGLQSLQGYANEIQKASSAMADGKGVFLFGGCGRGKTHMGIGLLLQWFARSLAQWRISGDYYPVGQGVFLSTVDFYLELKESYNGRKGESEILRVYSEKRILLLDDIGAEHATEWSRRILYALIDRRYRDARQTIITSNLSLKQIEADFDDRMASRIVEMCEVIKLDGPDYRVEPIPEQKRLPVGREVRA